VSVIANALRLRTVKLQEQGQ